MFRSRPTPTALLVVADCALLVTLRPDLSSLARGVAAPRQWFADAGADRVLADVAAAGLWLAAAWVAVGLLAAILGRLPGTAGRAAGAIARWALPAIVRRIVVGSAGLGVLLTPVSPLVAGAQPPPDGSGGRPVVTAAPLPGPSWPGSGAGSESAPRSLPPGPSWPGSTRPDHTAPRAPETRAQKAPAREHPTSTPTPTSTATPTSTPTPAPGPTPPATPRSRSTPPQSPSSTTPGTHRVPMPSSLPTVPRDRTPAPAHPAGSATVRAGDSLWLLAAHRLGPRAADSDVAAYLPDLYAANRSVIGDDPDLVRPGQVLSLPDPGPSTAPQESP